MIVMPWGRVGSNLVLAGVQRRARRAYGPDGFLIANEPLNQIREGSAQLQWMQDHYRARDGLMLVGSKHAVRAMADPPAIAAACRELDVQLIVMHRLNLVKVAVSQIRAEQYAEKTKVETGRAQWGVKLGSEGLGSTAIDPDVLIARIGFMAEATETLLRVFGEPSNLMLAYEDVLADPLAAIDRVSTVLSLELTPVELAFQKATSSDLREDVTNFEDLRGRLTGTPYLDQLLEA